MLITLSPHIVHLHEVIETGGKKSSSTHPEYVIDKEPPQQDAAGTDVVQVQQFHSVQGKGQAKQIVCYPVLWGHKTASEFSTAFRGPASQQQRLIGGSEWIWRMDDGQTHLFEQVPDSHKSANDQTNQVLGVKLIVDNFCRKTRRQWIQDKVQGLYCHCTDTQCKQTAGLAGC